MTVEEIIKKAGGVSAIADQSGKAIGREGLGRDAVYKWKSIGIPDRHWPLLIEMCLANHGFVLTPQHLYDANVRARAAVQASAA